MRRVDAPSLYILTHDESVFARMRALDARWQAQRMAHPAEMNNLPTGSIVVVDSAHPERPAWNDSRWRKWCGHLSVIIASSEPQDSEGMLAMDAGAAGYCHAYANEATLRQVVEVVSSGEIWVGRSLLSRLLRGVGQNLSPSGPGKDWRAQLTERESEVAALAAYGESNVAIADKLGITERTVKAHLTTIFEKLDVADRLQLALKVHGVK